MSKGQKEIGGVRNNPCASKLYIESRDYSALGASSAVGSAGASV